MIYTSILLSLSLCYFLCRQSRGTCHTESWCHTVPANEKFWLPFSNHTLVGDTKYLCRISFPEYPDTCSLSVQISSPIFLFFIYKKTAMKQRERREQKSPKQQYVYRMKNMYLMYFKSRSDVAVYRRCVSEEQRELRETHVSRDTCRNVSSLPRGCTASVLMVPYFHMERTISVCVCWTEFKHRDCLNCQFSVTTHHL